MIKDHKGNVYASQRELAAAYNMSWSTFHNRQLLGWNIEEILTTPVMKKRREKGKTIKDHLGNTYKTKAEMANAYGISVLTLNSRISCLKMSLEQALTTPARSDSNLYKPCTDHLGNHYPNMINMAYAYGISDVLLMKRLEAGMSLEEALTLEKHTHDAWTVKDHLGNVYKSQSDMAKAYGLARTTLINRLNAGMSLKDALTHVNCRNKSIDKAVDHKGNAYEDIDAMAEAYHLPGKLILSRIERGWEMERVLNESVHALHIPIFANGVKDHLGNTYDSLNALARAYRIGSTNLRYRLRAGWPLEDALTIPVGHEGYRKKTTDHLGNPYNSITEMMHEYNIDNIVYRIRIKNHWSQEEALTVPIGERNGDSRKKSVVDHLGNEYKSIHELAKAYHLSPKLLYSRRTRGWTLEEQLTTPSGMPRGTKL